MHSRPDAPTSTAQQSHSPARLRSPAHRLAWSAGSRLPR